MALSNKRVGMNIAKERAKRNMTQQQLAAVLNVSHQAVSKWENGMALPDLETLMNLSRLFGVTIEQLLSGGDDRSEEETAFDPQLMWDGLKEAADQTVQTVKGIGSALFKRVGKILESTNGNENNADASREDDGTCDSSIENTVEGADTDKSKEETSDQRRLSLEALLQLAPFMSREKVSELLLQYVNENGRNLPISTLLRFAPFVTKEAVQTLLGGLNEDELTAEEIVALAPFLRQDALFRLVIKHANRFDFAAIRKIAPFLKSGMVDMLAEVACGIKKTVNYETLSDLAQKVGKGVEDLAQNISDSVKAACQGAETQEASEDDSSASEYVEKVSTDSEMETNENDTKNKLSAGDALMKKALNDRSWDWIRLNIANANDGKLLIEIVITAANELSEEEARDILLNTAPYMDAETFVCLIDQLCESGHWERVCDLDPLIDMENAGAILLKTVTGGKNALKAVRLYAPKAPRSVWNEVSRNAIDSNNWELVNALTENIPSD